MLSIRKTRYEDLDKIEEIFLHARAFMKSTGNSKQWAGEYPGAKDVRKDIENNNAYVVVENNEVVATFAFIVGTEPSYLNIYDGAWLNDEKYGTIHRIASDGSKQGIFAVVLAYCLTFGVDIRIDTHFDNKVMQHLIEKNHFKYCGIIYVEDGSERLAYQLCKKF